jgi:DNA-binding beta-propeller fold protein YncE
VNPFKCTLSIVSLTLFAALPARAQPKSDVSGPPLFRITQTFHVGGEGGYDYITVDPDNKRLYIPRSTHTTVLDAVTGKTLADIPGQQRNHGVVLVPEVGRGFITDGQDATVVIFDLKTHKVLGKVRAAEDADGIIYDPFSHKVWVSCGDAQALIPIAPDVDPKTGKADAAVKLGGKPEFLAADGRGRLFVNLEDKDQVAVVDTRTMKVTAKWPTSPGGAPVGMSMDRDHRRLFIGCRNPQKLIVMNADNGKVLADLPIGAGVDATRYDDGFVFASCRDGTLAVARETAPGKFEIVQTVTTPPGAKTLDVDPTTHTLFLPTAEMGTSKDARGRPVPKPDSFMVVVVARPARK